MIQGEVLSFIPQRPPFVMIDEVLSADETVANTSFTIREGHLFVEQGVFTEPGLIENMAQTAAAGTGFKAQKENRPAPVGFIGALKGFYVKELPAVGQTITSSVRFLHQVLNAHIVQGTIMIGDKVIAECELKIFLQSETSNA